MQRRDFLRMSSLAALGGASTISCAVHRIRPNGTDLSISAMEEVLAEIEDGVRAVRAQISAERALRDPSEEALTRAVEKIYAGMYVYDAFDGMPVEGRAYPGMQHRIRAAAREFGQGMGSMRQILADPDPATCDAVDALLSTEEGVKLVARHADEVGAAAGATFSGRRRLQRLFHTTLTEVRERGTRAFAAEYVERVRTLEEDDHDLVRADTETALRFAEAREAWIRAGVAPAAFDIAMPTAAERPAMRGWGIGLTMVGIAGIVAGVGMMAAAPDCLCMGLFVVGGALLFLIPGIILWAKSGKPKKPRPKAVDDVVEEEEPLPEAELPDKAEETPTP